MNLEKLLVDVKEIAYNAGELIKNPQTIEVFSKSGKHNYVTQMDKKISDYLLSQLPLILPGSVVLSEEGEDRNTADTSLVWIVDPIDGTTNYMYHFRLSAISIALMKDGKAVLAVVYNPFINEMYWAAKDAGAYLNGETINVGNDESINHTLVLAETDPYSNRASNHTFLWLNQLFQSCIDIRITGSAALDFCYIAAGRAGAFLTPQLDPWDMAAGYLIMAEAGGIATHFDGSPLLFSGSETAIAGNPQIYHELLDFFNKESLAIILM